MRYSLPEQSLFGQLTSICVAVFVGCSLAGFLLDPGLPLTICTGGAVPTCPPKYLQEATRLVQKFHTKLDIKAQTERNGVSIDHPLGGVRRLGLGFWLEEAGFAKISPTEKKAPQHNFPCTCAQERSPQRLGSIQTYTDQRWLPAGRSLHSKTPSPRGSKLSLFFGPSSDEETFDKLMARTATRNELFFIELLPQTPPLATRPPKTRRMFVATEADLDSGIAVLAGVLLA